MRLTSSRLALVGLSALALVASGCGTSPSAPVTSPSPLVTSASETGTTAGSPDPVSRVKTVFLIVMENHNWSDIQGSGSAPYINGTLLPIGAHAENYYGTPDGVHPSLPNYLWLEAGGDFGIRDDEDPPLNLQATPDHLVTQLEAVGVSWRSYQEDKPAGCPIHGSGLYAPKHNPMIYFADVSGDPPSVDAPRCVDHVAPMSQLAADLNSGQAAQYNLLIPNLCNDMHDTSATCASLDPIANGDAWLSTTVPAIMASSAYKNDGAILITWDESEDGEHPIGMIVVSPLAKPNYSNDIRYFHSSTLRTIEQIFGVPYLRDANNQVSLSDLFRP